MAEATTFSQQLGSVKEFISNLSARQKVMLGGGAAIVAAALFLFVKFSTQQEMKPLYSGMEPAEAQALVGRLNSKNILAQATPDGTGVQVPADKLDTARLEVASQPSPRSGRMGFELFDKNNWATTDFDEHVTYQRALEGELERTIGTMNGVEAVRVHLTMATESLFSDKEQNAKAAVIVKLKSGRITPNMQSSIARLISSSVTKLAPEAVTVVDGNTNRAAQLPESPGYGDGLSINDALAQRVEKTLEPVIGADHVRASVQVQFENANAEENQETYDPNSAVAITVQRSEETTGTSQAGGPVGTASNLPNKSGTVPASRADSSQFFSRSENSTYVVNKLVRHTVRPSGAIRRLTAAVLVDDTISYSRRNGQQAEERQKRSSEQMKQIEELVKASIGFDASRGDTITVQNISFLSLPPETPLPITRTERARRVVNDYSSTLRLLALLVMFFMVYLLVLRPVKKQIMLSFDKTKELRARNNAANALAPTADEELINAPEPQPEMKRTAQLRKQLAQKVREQPAAAAQLVQSWLREDQQ